MGKLMRGLRASLGSAWIAWGFVACGGSTSPAASEPVPPAAPIAEQAPAEAPEPPAPPPAPRDPELLAIDAILARAEQDPAALAELEAMDHPRATALLRYFAAVGYGSTTGKPTRDLDAALAWVMSLWRSDDTFPCWLVSLAPVAWADIILDLDSLHARDEVAYCAAPLRTAPEQLAWVGQMNRALTHVRGPLYWNCGNIQSSYDREANALMVVAWNDPKAFARMSRPHLDGAHGQTTTLAATVKGVATDVYAEHPTTGAALQKELQAPLAWYALVEGHLVAKHRLTPKRAHAMAERLAEGLELLSIETHKTCEGRKEAIAAGADPSTRFTLIYGVPGSEIKDPKGVFGYW